MKSAERLRAALRAADEGGYGRTGWYSYIDRRWIEDVLADNEYLRGLLRPRREGK